MADQDWFPGSRPGQRAMFANIELKINSYAAKYPFLTFAYLAQIHAACQTFIAGYDTLVANRATAKQETQWFDNLLSGEPQGSPAPNGVTYQAVALPAGAFIGIEDFTRNFARLFKEQLNYDEADGLDLMIERSESEEQNLNDAQPSLVVSATNNATIKVVWQKLGFEMLELQYRKAGVELWQPADKSNTSPIDFAPAFTTPGAPEKFEVRGVYLIKNVRVGNWSPIYTVTVG